MSPGAVTHRYTARIVDAELEALLSASGAVLIEGPKACGKTATARQIAASEVLLDVDEEARQAAALDPRLILSGAQPRLIDEWQLEPSVWNHVRRAIDDDGQAGRFILAGSSVPAEDILRHSGAGRLTRLRMRPMSLAETGDSTAEISLADILDGGTARSADAGMSVQRLAELVAVGGWPGLLDRDVGQSLRVLRGYVDETRRVEVQRLLGSRRDAMRVARVIGSLARHTASYAAATTIAADAGGPDGALDPDTVREYIDSLRRLLFVEDQPAWAPHLRSRSRLRRASKRHFVDPSLAVAALRATPSQLLADLNTLGLVFESLVIRDLRVYAQALDGEVLQYRDNTGLEVDAIVESGNRQWAAFEIKLGAGQVDQAASTLLRFIERVDTTKVGNPSTLGVIVGTGYGYVREDGVSVIPIGALGP